MWINVVSLFYHPRIIFLVYTSKVALANAQHLHCIRYLEITELYNYFKYYGR
jgi:hypothetical protein